MSSIYTHQVVFGDCDPAGIVYYPRMFSWMDAAFHRWIHPYGGHANICAQIGALGLGLVSADAQFKRPLRDGDSVDIRIEQRSWSEKSLKLSYQGRVDGTECFTGTEIRCMFLVGETGIQAGAIAPLKSLLE